MAGDDLFKDLPPPTAPPVVVVVEKPNQSHNSSSSSTKQEQSQVQLPVIVQPAPALKSSLKRPKPQQQQGEQSNPPQAAPEKRLRFKTTTDASEKQVIEAMQKIASHIKNRPKFSKASKLAIQLIQAGSVKPATRDEFFAVLEVSMESLTTCNDPALRADYHALFSAAQDVADCLSKKQQNQLNVWTIRAVWANDLFTDDSFVFSKATGRIKEAISNLPVATHEEDEEEATALKDEKSVASSDANISKESSSPPTHEDQEHDPFGLDALIKDQISKGKTEALIDGVKSDEVEKKRFLKSRREALVACLEIAAKRYKLPWCQTSIDILAKHAFDNNSRFTTQQRAAIAKLWASIKEQQTLRRQGKSVSGKLDVNAFEYLQQKYSTQKISIRRAVGGGGGRNCEQWLG